MCTRKQPGPGPQRETDAKGNLHGCFGLQVKAAWKRYAQKHPSVPITRSYFDGRKGRWITLNLLLTLPNYHQGKL